MEDGESFCRLEAEFCFGFGVKVAVSGGVGWFYFCKMAFGCIEFPFLSGNVGRVGFAPFGRFRGELG